WLRATAGYRALADLRRRPEPAGDEAAAQTSDPADDPEATFALKHRGEIVRDCLSRLSRRHREVIDLVYYHEKSVQEAAAILGVPGNTVKTRMFHARKTLSELLAAGAGGGALAALNPGGRPASRRIEVGALCRDGDELVRRDHADAAALEPNPAALDPCPQLLVGALARHADHLADLALGDGRLARRRRALHAPGQLQQGLCQARRQVKKRDVLHLLAGAAQLRAENLDELEHHVRLTAQEGNEVAPLDDDELAVGHGGRIGGARAAVEQGDFPENIALAKDVEHDVLAVGGGDADFHRAGEHTHEPASRIALREDGGPARRSARLHVGAEVLDHPRRKIAKQRMAAQQGQLVTRTFPLRLSAWTRHEGSPPRCKRVLQLTCALEHDWRAFRRRIIIADSTDAAPVFQSEWPHTLEKKRNSQMHA